MWHVIVIKETLGVTSRSQVKKLKMISEGEISLQLASLIVAADPHETYQEDRGMQPEAFSRAYHCPSPLVISEHLYLSQNGAGKREVSEEMKSADSLRRHNQAENTILVLAEDEMTRDGKSLLCSGR